MLTNQVAPYLFIIIISSSMYVQSFILLSKNAQLFSLAATLVHSSTAGPDHFFAFGKGSGPLDVCYRIPHIPCPVYVVRRKFTTAAYN